MNHVFGPNWKTTCSGICSFLMITGVFVSGYLATQVANPAPWQIKLASGCTFAVGLMKVWIGFLMVDAGQVQAVVPGAGVQTVAAHETPDIPGAKPIIPQPK